MGNVKQNIGRWCLIGSMEKLQPKSKYYSIDDIFYVLKTAFLSQFGLYLVGVWGGGRTGPQ